MISQNLLQLERSIENLSPEEQLWLLERIARNLRQQRQIVSHQPDGNREEEELIAMAKDPQVQAEIAAINEEFSGTEMDGLEGL